MHKYNINIEESCNLYYEYIVVKDYTLRKTSELLGEPHTTIHNRIHTYFKRHYPFKYSKLSNKLRYNYESRFKPTSQWSDTIIKEEDL